jgi:hypothetical protein
VNVNRIVVVRRSGTTFVYVHPEEGPPTEMYSAHADPSVAAQSVADLFGITGSIEVIGDGTEYATLHAN